MARIKRKKRRRLGQCPCGSGKTYSACCGPFVKGEAVPQHAEELMRSRFSAYAKGATDYVIETTDPAGDAWEGDLKAWRARIVDFSATYRFLSVTIEDAHEDGDVATVTFLAHLQTGDGADASFSETSHFTRRSGRWLYASGEVSN